MKVVIWKKLRAPRYSHQTIQNNWGERRFWITERQRNSWLTISKSVFTLNLASETTELLQEGTFYLKGILNSQSPFIRNCHSLAINHSVLRNRISEGNYNIFDQCWISMNVWSFHFISQSEWIVSIELGMSIDLKTS